MLKLLIAAVVFAHGVGHILFLVPALRIADWAGQTGHSWALTPVLGEPATRILAGGVWGLAIALFVAAVGGLIGSADWWRTAAIGGAVVSLVGIVLFWDGITPTSGFFALVFDLLVLAALLLAHWPSPELVDG